MKGRTAAWDEGLARRLRTRKGFAAEFVAALVEDGDSPQEALRTMIRAYGVTEYAKGIDMSPGSLSRAMSPSHNISKRTLTRLMKPIGLRLGVAPAIPQKRKAAKKVGPPATRVPKKTSSNVA